MSRLSALLERFGPARLAWLLPLAAGLLSVALGQDANWDLQNYHLYNPFALLNGKIGLDLAPAQWQSYFNPTLDLLYYGLAMHLAAPLVCFLMGALHGLNGVLLFHIARAALPAAAPRLWLGLALAGCMAPAFRSQLGNTMGDNATALCVLGAVLLVLRALPPQGGPRRLGALLLAGLLMGAGAGLKLTNAMYALALCGALLAAGAAWQERLRAAFVFGLAVLAGLALTAGHWYWRMWSVFGNPLFPQFNQIFQGPMAAPIGIGDTGWLPKGLGERLLWPFLMTLEPRRVSELPLRDLLLPLLYLAVLALGALALLRRLRVPAQPQERLAPRARILLAFMALSWLVWLNLFSIYRYLVPFELLAPLMFWLLMASLFGARRGRTIGLCGVLLAALPLATGQWGRAGQAWQAFDVALPPLPAPAQTMVVTVHGDPPMGWLVPFFPQEVVFASLGSGFPESAAFRARQQAMLRARSGQLYMMVESPRRPSELARLPEIMARADARLADYGLQRDGSRCTVHAARVGRNEQPYQWCRIVLKPQG